MEGPRCPPVRCCRRRQAAPCTTDPWSGGRKHHPDHSRRRAPLLQRSCAELFTQEKRAFFPHGRKRHTKKKKRQERRRQQDGRPEFESWRGQDEGRVCIFSCARHIYAAVSALHLLSHLLRRSCPRVGADRRSTNACEAGHIILFLRSPSFASRLSSLSRSHLRNQGAAELVQRQQIGRAYERTVLAEPKLTWHDKT